MLRNRGFAKSAQTSILISRRSLSSYKSDEYQFLHKSNTPAYHLQKRMPFEHHLSGFQTTGGSMPYLYSLNFCRSFSSSANCLTSDDFSDVINDLIKKDDRHSINHGYVQKLKGVDNLNVLEQFCIESRPSNPQEALLTLQRLSNLFHTKKDNQIAEFLKSESYVSSLSTQFLNDEADISCLLEAAICIFNILEKLPDGKIDEDAPLNLAPNFDKFFVTFMERIKKRMWDVDVEKLNPDTVVAFYRCLESKKYTEIDPNFVGEYKKVLQRKIPDITSTATITTLLTTLNKEDLKEGSFSMLVLSKVEELSPYMLLGELVNVFVYLAENGYRKISILDALSEAIRNHTDILTLPQLERLANGIMKISFYNPRLVVRYCSDLISSSNTICRSSQVSLFSSFLSNARVTDEKVWHKLVKWMNEASRTANVGDIRYCVGSLALMNVNQKLCSSLVAALASRLQPTPTEPPLKWLNAVWSVASLKCLTRRLAESVLNETFVKELFSKEFSPEQKISVAQKLCQINSAAKYDLKDYRGPFVKINEFSFTRDTCHILKYGTKGERHEIFLGFLRTLYPATCITPPLYYPEYGTFVDCMLYYNPQTSKFDSVASAPKDDKLPLKGLIAVQYFNRRHFTIAYTDEDNDKRRLIGAYQMGIRHLQAAGAKVVVIAEHELEKCPVKDGIRTEIVYIKDKITQAAHSR
jgi:hypothetical protein